MTYKTRYEGNWRNVDEDCQLCEMEERTEWHLETADWVIAEKLTGHGDMVVYKRHTSDLSDDEWEEMERIVGILYDEFEIEVLMHHVEDHFHAHIIEG